MSKKSSFTNFDSEANLGKKTKKKEEGVFKKSLLRAHRQLRQIKLVH